MGLCVCMKSKTFIIQKNRENEMETHQKKKKRDTGGNKRADESAIGRKMSGGNS